MRKPILSLLLTIALGLCLVEIACQQETPSSSSGGSTSTGGTTGAIFPSSIGFTQPPAVASNSSTANSAQNYVDIFYYLMTKMDRDHVNLISGVPTPGLISYVEGFMSTLNGLGFTGVGTQSVNLQAGLPHYTYTCTLVNSGCTNYKFMIRQSAQTGSLFGASFNFTYDVVAWANNGLGFTRFLEGSFTPGTNNAGQGNFTLVTCATCSPVTHGTLNWDATQTFTHVRGFLFNVTTESSSPYLNGSLIVDMSFNPSTTETYLTYGVTNYCDTTAGNIGHPTCVNTGASPYTVGYAGALHSLWSTGNVFVWGVTNANNTTSGPTTVSDQACIDNLSPPVVDGGAPTACHTDGTDNFTALSSLYGPDNALNLTWGTGVWPLPDITDSPTF